MFVEEPNGAISGLSLIESPLKSNPDSYRSLLSALPLSGTIETLADGRRRLTYEIQGQGGMKTKTQAYVSSDNRSIKGYSRSELLMGAKPAKKSAFNYFWEGQRIGSLS